MDKFSETTNTDDHGFNDWADGLEKMSDLDISDEIHKRILEKGNLSNEDKQLFDSAYNYCKKLIKQNKQLEPNLLRIYLEEICGYKLSHINFTNLIVLLAMSGIMFDSIQK